MSFFENLGASLGGGAKTVVDKTKELSGAAAVKAQISAKEAKLGKLYKDLGKAYYKAHKDDEEFSEVIVEISVVRDRIEKLQKKLNIIQKTVRCEACDALISEDSVYCPKCGKKLSEEKTEAESSDAAKCTEEKKETEE